MYFFAITALKRSYLEPFPLYNIRKNCFLLKYVFLLDFNVACWNLFSISHVESESISLKNLKRRSEFFEKGNKKANTSISADRFKAGCLLMDDLSVVWWLLLSALVSRRLLAACFFIIAASCINELLWIIFFHGAIFGASPLVSKLNPCAVPPPSFRWLRVQCQCSGLPLW